MAQRQGVGNTGVQHLNIATILKFALVGTLVLVLGDLVLELVTSIINETDIDFVREVKFEVGDTLLWTARFAALYLVYRMAGSKDSLVRGSAIAYVGAFLHDLMGVILFEWELTLAGLVNNLYGVFVVIAFAAVVRLLNGQTILPGINIRL